MIQNYLQNLVNICKNTPFEFSLSKISIHAPANGATYPAHTLPICPCNFNPRSDERSDPQGLSDSLCNHNFNPRSDERSDTNMTVYLSGQRIFQSTLRRTERRQVSCALE